MISLSCTARTLHGVSAEQQHPGRPARGGRRAREPALPRLRRAALRLDRPRPGLAGPVSRCESCGLGVVGEPGERRGRLRELDRLGRRRAIRIANRAGFSAWLGGAGWAGLERGARYLFTAEAVRRLVANRDQVVERARWAPGAGIATMWQTILNGFTFGRNVALGALGRGAAAPAEQPGSAASTP